MIPAFCVLKAGEGLKSQFTIYKPVYHLFFPAPTCSILKEYKKAALWRAEAEKEADALISGGEESKG